MERNPCPSLAKCKFSGYPFASIRGWGLENARASTQATQQVGRQVDPVMSALDKVTTNHYLASIEPWHGHEVVVYNKTDTTWQRQVIDESLTDGHTIVTGDFDGDGLDEIVAGARTWQASNTLPFIRVEQLDTTTYRRGDNRSRWMRHCGPQP